MRAIWLFALVSFRLVASQEEIASTLPEVSGGQAAQAGSGAPQPSQIMAYNVPQTPGAPTDVCGPAVTHSHQQLSPSTFAPAPSPMQSPPEAANRDTQHQPRPNVQSIAWDIHLALWALFESWSEVAFYIYLGLALVNVILLLRAWKTQPFLSDGYVVRVRNLVFNLEQLVRQGPQSGWQGLAKLTDANPVNGYPNFAADNLSRVQSVDPNAPHRGEARIIYKPAIQVWHRALVYHYLVTIVSFMAVCALNVLGNYSAHAQEVVLPLTRAVTSIGLLFMLVEHWCFLGNMRPQVSAFYRLLAWEILSENLVVLQLFGEPSPVFAVCQDDRNPYQGYQHHHNSVTRVRRHYLAMATHAEALSTMGAATSSYGTAVCGITTAIFGALLGTVLPPASTVASDIVTGMVFTILLGAELEVLKGIVSWSRASNLYVKCAWIVDLANGFLRASDISTFLSEVLLPRANVWNAFTVDHNNFAALPELSVDLTLAAAVVAPAQDLNGEVAQAGAGAPAA